MHSFSVQNVRVVDLEVLCIARIDYTVLLIGKTASQILIKSVKTWELIL